MGDHLQGSDLGHADQQERLDRAIADARFQLRFDPDGSAHFEPATAGIADALATLLEIVATASRTGCAWKRFKACANPSCRRAFYDPTKNRSGKWCSKRCGDRIRARAARRRKRRSRSSY